MKLKSSLNGAALLAALALASGAAQAAVSYNIADGDAADPPGVDGVVGYDTDGDSRVDTIFGGTWIGGGAPDYTGSKSVTWYAELTPGTTDVVSTENAVAAGASPDPAIYDGLQIGPIGWQRTLPASFPNLGNLHGADFGLIYLTETADLTITVAKGDGSAIYPLEGLGPVGASLYSGWDTSTNALLGFGLFDHTANNPGGTAGLTYYGSGNTAAVDGPLTLNFEDLAAGYYTLWVGGDSTHHQKGIDYYTVTFETAAVPVPAAVWLFGSALAGFGAFTRRKTA